MYKYMKHSCKELDEILTKEFLIENCVNQKIPGYKVAQRVGCDASVIKVRMLKFDLPRRSMSEKMKGRKLTSEHLNHLREAWKKSIKRKGKKRGFYSKEHCKNISKAKKGHKLGPQSEEHLRKRLFSLSKGPNKLELRCMEYLNKLYSNKFEYTGNGNFISINKSADAYSTELETVVLFNGNYWHLNKYGLIKTEKNKRLREKIESKPFLKCGYNVWFIWEGNIKKIVKIYNRFASKSTWI